jgi:hypothetical protein
MSDESLQHSSTPGHDDFEREDMAPGAVFASLAGLAVVGIVIYFIIIGMYQYLDRYERAHQPLQNPLAVPQADTRHVQPQEIDQFPQPRLETNERMELNDFRLAEEKRLHSYGWVDEKAGVVHIPIERAMKMIVQQGIPLRPQAAASDSRSGKQTAGALRTAPESASGRESSQ